MQLGAVNPNQQTNIKVSASDFNFDALASDVEKIKQQQLYIMIGLAVLLLIILTKK
jgi:hypothetical protein